MAVFCTELVDFCFVRFWVVGVSMLVGGIAYTQSYLYVKKVLSKLNKLGRGNNIRRDANR